MRLDPANALPTVSGSRTSPRGSVESRLLDAAGELAGREGYARVTAERIFAVAGVSRGSFYSYFANAEECFWGAYRRGAERLVAAVAAAANSGESPELGALDALLDLAIDDPTAARLLMRESLCAGRAGLLQRDALIGGIERAMATSAQPRAALDIPLRALVGGIFRFLTIRLAEGPIDRDLRPGIVEWACAFAQGSAGGWRESLDARLERRPAAAATHRVARSLPARQRILQATALACYEQGFHAVRVADIVVAAGVSRRRFYNEFADKTAAFVAAYEDAYERTVAACAPAFFASSTWPERIWEGGCAFTAFLSREPLLAHLGFVECYAVDSFVPRIHATQLAFTLFLEEGYRQRPQPVKFSRVCSELTAEVVFETGMLACRLGPGPQLRRLQPLAVFIALTPFIGAPQAGAFIAGKLRAAGRPA